MIKRISVVAPAYNEEECIRLFIDKTTKTFKDNKLEGEILIVNDASNDKTADILQDISKNNKLLNVIHNKKNLGLTGAAWIGFRNAKENFIVFLPSDLESNPEEDIPILLKPLEDGYDMSVGWKQGSRKNIIKTVTSDIFNKLTRLIFKIQVHDFGWVKAFKKEVISNIELRSDWHRFLVVFVANQGYRIKEVKTKFYPRKTGNSKFGRLGFLRIPGGVFDMLAIKFILSFSKKPMFVFGTLGAIFLLIGFIGGSYLLITKLLGEALIQRIPLIFLLVILIISGIQLFALGFLAELLVTIREDIGKKK